MTELKPKDPNHVNKAQLELILDSMEQELACELSTYESTIINSHLVEIIQVRHDGQRMGAWLVDSVQALYKDIAEAVGAEDEEDDA